MACAGLGLLCSLVAIGASSASAGPLPQRIYFARFVDGGTRSVAEWARLDGGPTHRLPIPAGDNMTRPTASPDGSTILFTTTEGTINRWLPRGTWIAQPDGSKPRRIGPGVAVARCPSWRPDGRAFVQMIGGDSDPRSLQIVDLHARSTTLGLGSTKVGCAAFLDSHTIVYERESETGTVDLWEASLSPSTITHPFVAIPGCNSISPEVSPDGRSIAFQTGCADHSMRGLYIATSRAK